jgi:DNA-binding transcriptional regulator/RsmH inhibitor MraZ
VYLFTGHRDHKIDGKDRIVVPSAYAAAIAASGEAAVYLVPGEEGRYLEAYPADVFREMAQGQIPSRFEGGQAQRRAFFQNAEHAELNGPGRITLPKRFLEFFPKGVVRIAGMNTYLELWDPELWEKTVGRAAHGGGESGRGGAHGASRG